MATDATDRDEIIAVVVVAVDADRVVVLTVEDAPRRVEIPNDDLHLSNPAAVAPLALADLMFEDDEPLLDVRPGQVAVRCDPHVVGPATARRIQLRGDGLPDGVPEVSPGELGLDTAEAQAAESDRGLNYLYLGGDPFGLWEYEGGLARWREERAAGSTKKPPPDWTRRAFAQKRAIDGWGEERWDEVFANPYTFVSFPLGEPDAICPRGAPNGHRSLGEGLLAGSIDIRWTAHTPVLVRGPRGEDGVHRFPTVSAGGEARPAIPGSSLKGAIRSLHETLAGGCLRVVDLDFLPSYRDPVKVRPGNWTLARVDRVDHDGRPAALTVCDDVVWVTAEALHTVHGPDRLQSGSTVNIHRSAVQHTGPLGRAEVLDATGVEAGTDWVVLLTDAAARFKPSYFAATGRLGQQVEGVTDDAWRDYLASVDGTDDVRRAQQSGGVADEPALVAVEHPKRKPIGRRYSAARRLTEGQSVWLARTDGQVTALALAAVWRHAGAHAVRDRVPPGLEPCRSGQHLCASCRVFGSADTEGATGGPAQQDGYRGHVRFGSAVAAAGTRLEVVPLPPMGAPRLGAGQFSLRPHRPGQDEQASPGENPAREWGAGPDREEIRRIRGRKFYWHADPEANGRHRRREAKKVSEMAATAQVAPAGTVFEARLTFENLSRSELGGLLAAIDPGRALGAVKSFGVDTDTSEGRQPDIAPRLGGGRPLGFGTVEVTDLVVRTHDGLSRYGDATAPDAVPVDELVADFVTQVPDEVEAIWPDLVAVLDIGHVNPAVVWYPPGAFWDDQQSPNFDEGYEFWRRSAGRDVKDDEPIIGLDDPRFPDQYLPIETRRGR